MIQKQKTKKRQSGFTLIETVLYLAVVGILFVAVINFHLILGGNVTKLSSNIDASRNRRMALGVIEYLIRNADGMLRDVSGECNDFDAPSLALYFNDDTYLSGTCVDSGGGIKLGLDNGRLVMSCHPNITYNGQYGACDVATSTSHYLTTADVGITTNDLRFSTSSNSSNANGFMSVTTYLRTSVASNEQIDLKASSAATSTTNLRNEQANGLLAWYKFDDDDPLAAADSAGNFDLACDGSGSPTAVAGLVDGSSGAFYFSSAESDECIATNTDALNFNGPFTLSAWVQTAFESVSTQNNIIDKSSWGAQKGYVWSILSHSSASTGRFWLRVFDGNSYTNTADSGSYILNDGVIYNIIHIYDPDNDSAVFYLYEKGVGLVNSTTVSGVPTLVNYDSDFKVASYFDGTIDELKIYNRALTEDEVFAIQSQGAN